MAAGRSSSGDYLESVSSDEQAIIDLAIAYTWALDTKQLDQLREVFLPDATADLNGTRCNGLDAIITAIGERLDRLDATQHLVGNHQVRIDGDTATHRCHLQSQHIRRGVEGGDNYVLGGTYEDRVVRTEDGWRIAHRTLTATWTDGNRAVTKR